MKINIEYQKQQFRLAAVLYADNNYEITPKTIHKKVIESALLSNGNKKINIHQLIDFIHKNYNFNFDEQEVISIVTNEKEDGFLIQNKSGETIVSLSEKRKRTLETKISDKTIDHFIVEFEKEKKALVAGNDAKAIIYRFLYELLSTNIESFKKLLDSKRKIEELINVESYAYSPIEREIINEFLGWDNNEKNKAIFDIASYAIEYCLISNNNGASAIHLNNLKNKIFYLDTNVIFRVLGINGANRQNRTVTFLQKFIEANEKLVISKYTEMEFKDTIAFYIDKLKKKPLNRKINPSIFQEKFFKNISELYDFYYKWRAGKYNDSLELFEGYISSLYEKFKTDFNITTDYKIPFDETDEKTEKHLKELSASIASFKNTEGASHNINTDYNDACNINLAIIRRDDKNSNLFEAKYFFVSTDQALRRWDYNRNTVTPIVILPSQWLSILLRYVNRTNDDFKSFVSFLNLPSGESQIDGEKLHIILEGISEMTENFDQQRYIVQSLIQKKFVGILEKGIKDEEILERTKTFAKTELEKKVEEISFQHNKLKSDLDAHKIETTSKENQSTAKVDNERMKRIKAENDLIKVNRDLYFKDKLYKWRRNNWLEFMIGILIFVSSLCWILSKSNWDAKIAMDLVRELNGNLIFSSVVWLAGLYFSIVSVRSLVAKYRNHSNIKAFLDNLEKFDMPNDLKNKAE